MENLLNDEPAALLNRDPELPEFLERELEGKEAIRQTKVCINQSGFRRVILEIYNHRCCVTGLDIPRNAPTPAWTPATASASPPPTAKPSTNTSSLSTKALAWSSQMRSGIPTGMSMHASCWKNERDRSSTCPRIQREDPCKRILKCIGKKLHHECKNPYKRG